MLCELPDMISPTVQSWYNKNNCFVPELSLAVYEVSAHLQSHLQCTLLSGHGNDLHHCPLMDWQYLHVENFPQV